MKIPLSARLLTAFVVCVAGPLAPRALRGEGAAIGVRYRAPVDCPTEAEFFAEARQRNPRLGTAGATESPQLIVTIGRGMQSQFVGRLERVTATGAVGVREINGESCHEVATALALITAVTGDLVAGTVPSGASSSEPEGSVPGEPRGDAVSSHAAAERTSPAPLFDKLSPESQEQNAAAGRVAGYRWQTGIQGVLASGVTESPLFGASAFVQVSARTSAAWAPSARLSLSLSRSSWASTDPESAAQAEFWWAMASLDGCPIQIGDPLGLSVQPCARASGGLLRASGTGRPSGPTHESRPWTDVGALVRGHWQVSSAAFVDLEAALFVPLQRYEFAFGGPTEVVYEEPVVGLHLGAGMGLVFR